MGKHQFGVNRSARRRININALETRLNKHRMTIYRWYTEGQKGFCDFPKPHFLGPDRQWWEDEVEDWEIHRMAEIAEQKQQEKSVA